MYITEYTTLWKYYARPYHVTSATQIACNTRTVLPERNYVTLGSLLSQIRLSSVTFVRPTQGIETFGNISLPFSILAVL